MSVAFLNGALGYYIRDDYKRKLRGFFLNKMVSISSQGELIEREKDHSWTQRCAANTQGAQG
jgi:hypothetical protein